MTENNGITLPNPKDRKIFFGKQVDQSTIEEVTKKIIEINDHDKFLKKMYSVYNLEYTPKPIKIYIDSYGGAVYQIFGLVSIIEKSKTPVHTIATGAAMSAGFILLMFGHKRFAYKNATLMYHQVSAVAFGKVEDMDQTIVEIKRLQDKLEEFTIRKTNIPKTKLEKIKKEKIDWYITSEEALNLGVIDKII